MIKIAFKCNRDCRQAKARGSNLLFIKILFLTLVLLPVSLSAQEEKELIAYSRLSSGFWQIWIMDLGKGENQQLTTSPADKRYPIWIEHGKKIMYRTNNAEMFIIGLKDKQETQILDKFGVITDPAFSDINQRLLFTRYQGGLQDESEIWSVNLEGEGQKVLTNQQGMQYNPCWSPDGSKIVYTSGKSFGTHQICVMDKDGNNSRTLTRNTGKYDILPVYSPDGKGIAFASNRDGDFDVWIMDQDAKSLNNLTQTESLDTKPSFSPGGEKIIFTSARSGCLQIWTMNADGTNPSQLSDGKSECQDASWTRIIED